MRTKRFEGYICWYDRSGDDGILYAFDGRDYYFNSFSLPGTHYVVTGKCKKTGRKKTVKTKHFPGLFLERKLVRDRLCNSEMLSGMPVTFEQADGLNERWAVKVKLNLSKAARLRVLDYKIQCVKKWAEDDLMDFTISEAKYEIWAKHRKQSLARLLEKRKMIAAKDAKSFTRSFSKSAK